METGTNGKKTTQREIIAGVRVLESEYKVQRPVFEDVKIERPVYVDKKVERPVGMSAVIDSIVEEISTALVEKCLNKLDDKLVAAIDKRVREIEVPKIVYVEEVRTIDKPVFRDVDVINPVLVDREVLNPVLTNVEVKNAVIKDVEVEKPVYKERIVIQPKFEEVVIQKPKWVDKEVTAIHIKYVDPKGNPE